MGGRAYSAGEPGLVDHSLHLRSGPSVQGRLETAFAWKKDDGPVDPHSRRRRMRLRAILSSEFPPRRSGMEPDRASAGPVRPLGETDRRPARPNQDRGRVRNPSSSEKRDDSGVTRSPSLPVASRPDRRSRSLRIRRTCRGTGHLRVKAIRCDSSSAVSRPIIDRRTRSENRASSPNSERSRTTSGGETSLKIRFAFRWWVRISTGS
jgi:hypothetical protein